MHRERERESETCVTKEKIGFLRSGVAFNYSFDESV